MKYSIRPAKYKHFTVLHACGGLSSLPTYVVYTGVTATCSKLIVVSCFCVRVCVCMYVCSSVLLVMPLAVLCSSLPAGKLLNCTFMMGWQILMSQ